MNSLIDKVKSLGIIKNIKNSKSCVYRIIRIIAGILFLIIGVIGVILPVMPSVIFFVIALACLDVNIKKHYYRFLNNRLVKRCINNLLKINFIKGFIEKHMKFLIADMENATVLLSQLKSKEESINTKKE